MMRVAISGCGAVAQLYYSPALRLLVDEARVVGVFDPDKQAAEQLAHAHRAEVTHSFEELLRLNVDLLIVASPPRFHADQVCAAVGARIPVLCEKPMALSVADGERMVHAAASVDRPLGIGMVRRLLPQAILIRSLLQNHALGSLLSIEVFEGGFFEWPISSPAWFAPDEGGGILEDVGVHVLDLLSWWLGEPSDVEYADDAMGGVAANCRIGVTHGDTSVSVRLSRDWPRPNGYRFTGTAGWIHWAIHERDEVEGELDGCPLRITPSPPCSYSDAIAAQIRAVVDGQPVVDGAEGLRTLHLMERCRKVREPMIMEWL